MKGLAWAAVVGCAATAPHPDAKAPRTLTNTGSAYVGCGEPISRAQLWDEATEDQVLHAIDEAKACAAEHERRVLLEFVAHWCADCREMTRLEALPSLQATLRQRFERVRINLGQGDRHEALRESLGVDSLATYVVLDPKTSQLLAKTTLEPISKPGKPLSAEAWQRWLEAH